MAGHQSSGTGFEVSGRKAERAKVSVSVDKGSDDGEDITDQLNNMAVSGVAGSAQNGPKSGYAFENVTLKHGLNVSRDSDEVPCEIRGFVMLNDKLIVCDKANKKLKMFDSCYTHLYEYKCEFGPYNIEKIDNNTVVVTNKTSSMRLFSVPRDDMAELKKIDTEYANYGVCFYEGHIYCVIRDQIGSERFSQVRVYTPEGKLKRRFEYLSDGKEEFTYLGYIAVNQQTGVLYITDFYKGVVAMTKSGNVIAVLSPSTLINPEGIAFDDYGQVYVCGCGSSNLIQMSADGNGVVELLSKSIRCKRAQYVKIYGNKLLLVSRNSDTIAVYGLS